MTRWKIVPVELTPEMNQAANMFAQLENDYSNRAFYSQVLAAAPAWEPSEEDMTRAMAAWITSYRRRESADASLRAAILAAVGGHDEH